MNDIKLQSKAKNKTENHFQCFLNIEIEQQANMKFIVSKMKGKIGIPYLFLVGFSCLNVYEAVSYIKELTKQTK